MIGIWHFIRLRGAGLCLACLLGLLGPLALLAAPAQAEKRVALAIGNDVYPNLPADRQLRKAANDAGSVAETLKSLGFEVILGTNLGRQGMIDRLADFTARRRFSLPGMAWQSQA